MFKERETNQQRISIERLDESRVEAVAELYANVFAGPPWNEYTRCGNCLTFFGRESEPGQSCSRCGGILKLAYPKDETTVYIRKEASRPNAVCLIIKENPLSGFAWGFSYESPEAFVQEKYRTEEMRIKIKSALQTSGISGQFFYFSECGIAGKKRGKGLSNLLTEELIQEAEDRNLPLVMRTNYQSPMMAVAERFTFTQVMGPKVEINRLSKTITATGEIVNDFIDSEIPERALFIKL